jgi:hypothetical protein
LNFTNFNQDTDFVLWLMKGDEVFIENLKQLSPSRIDIEIRQYPITKMNLLLSAISRVLDTKRDFELYQALIKVILKVSFL